MNRVIAFINEKLNPISQKILNNVWINGITESFQRIMPFILMGAFSSLVSILSNYVSWIPDLSVMNKFTMGLNGILVAVFIPYLILEKKSLSQYKALASVICVITYFILMKPEFNDELGCIINFDRFGGGGIMLSMIIGLYTSVVFVYYDKFSISENKTAMPDFVYGWFATMLPALLVMLPAIILTFVLNFDVYSFIESLFMPLLTSGHTLTGVVVITFLQGFIYAFGINPACIAPVCNLLYFSSIDINARAVAAGQVPPLFNTPESWAWVLIGGVGSTLALNVLMTRAKSRKLRTLGKVTILPSLIGINEPVIYGAPIAMNPVLMIPTWINSFLVPFVYVMALKFDIMPNLYNEAAIALFQIPFPINCFLIGGMKLAPLLVALTAFAASFIVTYPFFKAYDNQCLAQENRLDG